MANPWDFDSGNIWYEHEDTYPTFEGDPMYNAITVGAPYLIYKTGCPGCGKGWMLMKIEMLSEEMAYGRGPAVK